MVPREFALPPVHRCELRLVGAWQSPDSKNTVLTSWYIRRLDNSSLYVLILRLSRVAKRGPDTGVGLGRG